VLISNPVVGYGSRAEMVGGEQTAEGLRGFARAVTTAIAAAALLLLASAAAESVRAEPAQQSAKDDAADTIDLGARGAPGSAGPAGAAGPSSNLAIGPVQFSPRAGFATEYMSRGTTQSAHQPAAGAVIEATLADKLYATAGVTSVRLPGNATAEVALSYGVRPSFSSLDFDISWNYYAYPGQGAASANGGSQYGEGVVRADTKLGEKLHLAAGFAVSPNYSNTGAWSEYTAAGLGYELPRSALPEKLGAIVTGGAGYFVFGNQSAAIGGFPLPAYLNWNFGVTFERGNLHFDFRYFDSNLSKSSCFVLTGDPNATLGGSINPLTNPRGLQSNWCSATLVGKFWFALN
jgi:uncharacterized protein (TIGR02001 family)